MSKTTSIYNHLKGQPVQFQCGSYGSHSVNNCPMQSSLVVSETMFPCLEYGIKRSLLSECKQPRRARPVLLSFGMMAVSTDQPPLSYMRFIVAALFVFMTDHVGIAFFSARYSPAQDLSSYANWVASGSHAVRWDVIYTPGAIPISCHSAQPTKRMRSAAHDGHGD